MIFYEEDVSLPQNYILYLGYRLATGFCLKTKSPRNNVPMYSPMQNITEFFNLYINLVKKVRQIYRRDNTIASHFHIRANVSVRKSETRAWLIISLSPYP